MSWPLDYRNPLVSTSSMMGSRDALPHLAFSMESGNPNFDSHAGTEHTEPLPQPRVSNFLTFQCVVAIYKCVGPPSYHPPETSFESFLRLPLDGWFGYQHLL